MIYPACFFTSATPTPDPTPNQGEGWSTRFKEFYFKYAPQTHHTPHKQGGGMREIYHEWSF
jgi:hypothetical protein